MKMHAVSIALHQIQSRIQQACTASNRNPQSVQIVAVSKTHPVDVVREAYDCGLRLFGESRVQEAEPKVLQCGDLDQEWHFIGHLQSNKTKKAVALFDLIHSVDSVKLIEKIDQEAAKKHKQQRILLQVNLSGETSKFGANQKEIENLVTAVAQAEHLRCEGWMTVPPKDSNPRSIFRQLRELANRYHDVIVNACGITHLSMGMTNDYEVAVEEGATLVRIGTAIFGERQGYG